MAKTIGDLITGALSKVRAARAGDLIAPEDMQLGLDVLNELLDFWNADDRAAYSVNPFDFTLTPNHSPHTIGVAASAAGNTNPDFVVTGTRPAELKFAALNLGGNPAAYTRIHVRDDAWYQRQPIPALTNTLPTDVFYSPDWSDPNATGLAYGSVYFWGIPSIAYGVRLWLKVLLAQVVQGDTFSLPPAYYHALKLTLAEWIAEDFGQPISPNLERQAREARDVVFGANVSVPRVHSRDAGMPRGARGGGSFNYGSRSFSR